MKSLDINNLSLRSVVVILLLFTSLLSVGFWAHGRKFNHDGVRGIAVDGEQRLTIQIGNELLRYTQNGSFLDRLDLTTIGVNEFVGDLTFLSDNSLLIRRGGYSPNLFESVAIFNRERNYTSLTEQEDEGLFRCQLDNRSCVRFGDGNFDTNRGFFSTFDEQEKSVFISDASRHSVYKFSETGELLSARKSGFDFPNELAVADDKLYVVDTNNKQIKQLSRTDTATLSTLSTHPIANPHAKERGFEWPFIINRIGNYWWVIIVDNRMHMGGVYLYDLNWRYVMPVPLPEPAIPVQISSVGEQVYIADLEANDLYRFDRQGRWLGVFDEPILKQVLAHHTTQRNKYNRIWLAALLAISFLVVTGLLYSIYRNSKKTWKGTVDARLINPADISLQQVAWLSMTNPLHEYNNIKKIQLIGLVSIVIIYLSYLTYVYNYTSHSRLYGLDEPLSFGLSALLVMLGIALLVLSEHGRIAVGTVAETVVLKDNFTKKITAANGQSIVYDGRSLAIGEHSVTLQSTRGSKFRLEQVISQLYPLILKSTTMSTPEMHRYRQRNGSFVVRQKQITIGLLIGTLVVLSMAILSTDVQQ